MKRLGHFFINRWKTWLDISFIVLYAVLTLLLVLHHEPWRDEAHPWLIVQRYGFIELFFKYLHLVYGGCPFLWYLLLFPFVKLGFPYTSMLFLNWSIAVGAAALFVINAPFKRIFKYCLIFSYYLFFEYAVIGRNYALTTLVLFAVASLYKKRHESIGAYCFALFLLFNTHYYIFPLASALFSLLVYETIKRKSLNGKTVFWLCFACLVLIVSFLGELKVLHEAPIGYIRPPVMMNVFNPLARSLFPVVWDVSFELAVVVGVVTLVALFLYLLRKPAVLYIYMANVISLFIIFMYFHPGELRHFGLVLMTNLFVLWIEPSYSSVKLRFVNKLPYQEIRNAIFVILTMSVVLSFRFSQVASILEWQGQFSGSKEAAKFIEAVSEKFHLQDRVIVCDRSDIASAVAAYLPNRKFWYSNRQEFGTFNISSVTPQIGPEEGIIQAGRQFQYLENLLFLFSTPLEFDRRFGYQFKLLYYTEQRPWGHGSDEIYFLYLAVPEQ